MSPLVLARVASGCRGRRLLVALVLLAAVAIEGEPGAGGTEARANTSETESAEWGSGGHWLAARDGEVLAGGDADLLGSALHLPLGHPIVGIAPTRAGEGYWLAGSDGGVFAFGDAGFVGSAATLRLAAPIAAIAPTASGNGYWLAGSDGGVFAFGDAAFHGSTGALKLAAPIVGMAATPTGNGYWFVAGDGGVFAFGDAAFHGSTGALKLAAPIVGMAATPSGQGYWLTARDGGIFAFGDAGFLGSAAGRKGVFAVGVMPTATGDGYRVARADGATLAFGDAGADEPSRAAAIVGIAAARHRGPSVTPICTSSSEPHSHLVYARPFDGPDRYLDAIHEMVAMLGWADALVRRDARESSGGAVGAGFPVLCDRAGGVLVSNVALPTPAATTGLGTIIADLAEGGFRDPLAKYWVHYDGARVTDARGGYGTLDVDDRSDPALNANDRGPDYAILVAGAFPPEARARILLHEVGHTLGAVQPSAPHSDGGAHCTESADVMCGSVGPGTPGIDQRCADRWRFDCGYDDYFSAAPAPGSYLATHWNVARSRWVRLWPVR